MPQLCDCFANCLYADDLTGIFVRGITEGCAAALDGHIKIHDQIIAVCTVSNIACACLFVLP